MNAMHFHQQQFSELFYSLLSVKVNALLHNCMRFYDLFTILNIVCSHVIYVTGYKHLQRAIVVSLVM